jgi:hypothetical protein
LEGRAMVVEGTGENGKARESGENDEHGEGVNAS